MKSYDPADPCEHCGKPKGWDFEHEKNCHKNPDHQFHECHWPGCHALGPHISIKYRWLCALHHKLDIWTTRTQLRRGVLGILQFKIRRLTEELKERRDELAEATEILNKEQREFDIFEKWMEDYTGV